MQYKFLIVCLLFSISSFAQGKSLTGQQKTYYGNEMVSLQNAIQTHFFDSSKGFYREHDILPVKSEHAYSYLWPLCGMIQAANEIEKVTGQKNVLQPIRQIIKSYYNASAPAAGYASYIMQYGGGSRFYDDNQWIGLASMDAYFRTREPSLLQTGHTIYQFMMSGFDTTRGGGLYWEEGKKDGKNTCSNGPGIILALQLYKATKDKKYLDTALQLYHWVNQHLKSPSGIYYDNISMKSGRIGRAMFSYNTGTMLQSNVYLYESTGDKKYLEEAVSLADSSLRYFYGTKKFRDGYWFNAVLLRGYQQLLKHVKDTKYILGFKECVDNALRNDKNEKGLMGKPKSQDLVNQSGMLEILARFAYLETKYNFNK